MIFVLAVLLFINVVNAKVSSSLGFKLPTKWIASASAGLALQFGMAHAALADAIPLVGTPAPSFKLPSNAGKDISLADLKGKRTVLYFYPVS